MGGKNMFEYVKFKIIKQSENPHWLFNRFVGTEKQLNGRIVKFRNGTTGNHQIQHPNFSDWFDVKKELIEVVS